MPVKQSSSRRFGRDFRRQLRKVVLNRNRVHVHLDVWVFFVEVRDQGRIWRSEPRAGGCLKIKLGRGERISGQDQAPKRRRPRGASS